MGQGRLSLTACSPAAPTHHHAAAHTGLVEEVEAIWDEVEAEMEADEGGGGA